MKDESRVKKQSTFHENKHDTNHFWKLSIYDIRSHSTFHCKLPYAKQITQSNKQTSLFIITYHPRDEIRCGLGIIYPGCPVRSVSDDLYLVTSKVDRRLDIITGHSPFSSYSENSSTDKSMLSNSVPSIWKAYIYSERDSMSVKNKLGTIANGNA